MTDLAAATSELIWRVDECRSNSQTTFLLGDSNCSNILLCQEILAYLVSLSQFFHQLTSEHYSQLDPFLPKDMLKKLSPRSSCDEEFHIVVSDHFSRYMAPLNPTLMLHTSSSTIFGEERSNRRLINKSSDILRK